jgi:hypothetical protein
VKLAAIATLYGRHDKTLPLLEQVLNSSRVPDELWLMCEGVDDAKAAIWALNKLGHRGAAVTVLETNLTPMGTYAIIPYSNKINWALDRTKADAVVYIDNGSMPSREKYGAMLKALEENPSWGAVYCSQERSGYDAKTQWADSVVENAYAVLNYTQVMHRVTNDRWTTNMSHADPDLADALFWRDLHKSIGPFHPVDTNTIHDWHHINSQKAEGV